MALRKITIDNSVKYTPKSEQTRDKDIKPNTIKKHFLVNKTKIFQIIKNLLEILQQKDLPYLNV